MPFRMSLKKLIRRDPVASLRERAAELQARIPAPKPQAEAPPPAHAEPITKALREQGDAKLLALAPAFAAAVDLYQQRTDEENAVCAAAGDDGWPGPAPKGSGAEWQAWFQKKEDWRERTGMAAAEEASSEAGAALFEVEELIANLPAASLAGLKLKARVAQRSDDIGVDWPDGLGEGLVRDLLAFTPPPEVDWHKPPPGFMASPAIDPVNFARIPNALQIELQRLHSLALAEYHRLAENLHEHMEEDEARARRAKIRADLFLPTLTAAVDPDSDGARALAALERPPAASSVSALIEEHREAYAEWDRLSEVWSGMLISDPGYAEARAASDAPRRRETAAYDALFAAYPSDLPDVVALAEYLHEATERVRIDVEQTDGERALAVIAKALRGVMMTSERHPAGSLVDMIGVASASLGELQALHNTASLVGGVAYAACWQGRCKARGAGDELNAAGKLMQWLGDALTDVETAANNEARRRTPANNDDRETRLEMLALPVIQNGDQDETEAFARELLAHVETERQGR